MAEEIMRSTTDWGLSFTDISIRKKKFNVKYERLPSKFKPWIKEATRRIHSIAANRNSSLIGESVMRIGFAKLLYALNKLELDWSRAFVLFAPDGTFSMNMERLQRGFTYGAVIHFGTTDYLAVHNAMPNGCGFSIYELDTTKFTDEEIIRVAQEHQKHLSDDKKLNIGNHFAGVYRGIDPVTNEDSGRRFVVIHCSGHVGKKKLYWTDYLSEVDGYNRVETPLGAVTILQDQARKEYLDHFNWSNSKNEGNRECYLKEIFGDGSYKTLASVTHQGLFRDGTEIRLGVQESAPILPIAYNAVEGLDMVEGLPNITEEILTTKDPFIGLEDRPYYEALKTINIVPHGGGYEFDYLVKKLKITVNKNGIEKLKITLHNKKQKQKVILEFKDFKAIRSYLRYRTRAEILSKVYYYKLARPIYHLNPLFQIYPPIQKQTVYIVAPHQQKNFELKVKIKKLYF